MNSLLYGVGMFGLVQQLSYCSCRFAGVREHDGSNPEAERADRQYEQPHDIPRTFPESSRSGENALFRFGQVAPLAIQCAHMRPARRRPTRGQTGLFDVERFLASTRIPRRVAGFASGDVIFRQGDTARSVMYIQAGRVKLSVVSARGREAIVGVLGRGDFFGEACLAGETVRMSTATAMIASRVLTIQRARMRSLLEREPALSQRFIAYILTRSIRVEQDLVDRLFNSAERRFARALILMARYGRPEGDAWVLPSVPQETLAEMVGTTRPRINFFMNKFRALGFISYNGELVIRTALLGVVVHD